MRGWASGKHHGVKGYNLMEASGWDTIPVISEMRAVAMSRIQSSVV